MDTMAHGWFPIMSFVATLVVMFVLAAMAAVFKGSEERHKAAGNRSGVRGARSFMAMCIGLMHFAWMAGAAVTLLSIILNVIRYAKGGA